MNSSPRCAPSDRSATRSRWFRRRHCSSFLEPEHPVAVVGDGLTVAELPPAAIDVLVDVAGAGAAFPLLSVEVRHLEGELGRDRPANGALSSIEARYAAYAVGATPTLELQGVVRSQVDAAEAGNGPVDGQAHVPQPRRHPPTNRHHVDRAGDRAAARRKGGGRPGQPDPRQPQCPTGSPRKALTMNIQTNDRPSTPLAATLERFFETKTSRDVDGTMSYFAPDLATYTDATLGWDLNGFEALRNVFAQYMPGWASPARSYATGILSNDLSVLVQMVDTPELFGGQPRIPTPE